MFRRKLLLNIVIVLICGTVAISLPIIAQHLQKTTYADKQNYATEWELISIYLDNPTEEIDALVCWQIECRCGNKVLGTWEQIYQAVSANQKLLEYDKEHLQVTSYGLVYRNIKTTADYQTLLESGYHTVVSYQNHSCELTLA